MIRGCFLRVQETLLIFIGEHNKAFPVVTMRVSDKDLLLLTPAHVNVFFTLCRSSLTNVAAKNGFNGTEVQTVFAKLWRSECSQLFQ